MLLGDLKRLLISSGEPAGIGPDICLQLDPAHRDDCQLVILADSRLLKQRAQQLTLNCSWPVIESIQSLPKDQPGCFVWHHAYSQPVKAGQLDAANSSYVLQLIIQAALACQAGQAQALVTAPVHKGLLHETLPQQRLALERQFACPLPDYFLGHTEFLQFLANLPRVVMMLACQDLKAALVTSHIPVKQIAQQISIEAICQTATIAHKGLKQYFHNQSSEPSLALLALNPHAGENGHLGREEIEIIEPALRQLQTSLCIAGPLAADTAFTPANLARYDAFIGLYHDQILPTFKHIGFHRSANITLGLPYIRTSVDHGTAVDLAATGRANPASLNYAINQALQMLEHQPAVPSA